MDKRVLAEKKAKEEYCAAYLELEKTTLAQVENLYPSILVGNLPMLNAQETALGSPRYARSVRPLSGTQRTPLDPVRRHRPDPPEEHPGEA